MMMSGAFSTIPMVRLEALFDVPPLHIHHKQEASACISCCYRLMATEFTEDHRSTHTSLVNRD